MKRYTLSSPVFVAVLGSAVLGSVVFSGPAIRAGVLVEEGPLAREFPSGIGAVYRSLSESILAEDMPTFMKVFHRDFLYESLDGSGLDRGPWRRLWLDRFADLKYETVAFSAGEVHEKGDDRVVISVRRVAVVESSADGSRQLEETVFQDTWTRSGTTWELELRVESKILSRGAVAGGGGTISSPRVAALAASLRAGDKDATASFWKDVRKSGAPLVESIPGDPTHRLVTFLWRGGGKETSVRVRGGLPAREGSKPLVRLDGTDVWYLSERISSIARFTYEFQLVSAVEIPRFGEQAAEAVPVRSTAADPLNRRSLDGASLVEMPGGGPPVTWTEKVAGRPRGVVKRHAVPSDVLGERRFVTVYTPPGYGELSSPCVAAFVIDNGSYKSRRVTGTVLDNLSAEKKIRKTVLFMVHDEGSRRETLEASEEFVRFLGEELVAWARENFEVHRLARHTVIGGSGLGGLLAVSAAIAYPDTFGEVLAENGTFSRCVGESGAASSSPGYRLCVPGRLAVAKKLPLRFYLVVGSLEEASVRNSNLHLRDVLKARGYSTSFRFEATNRHATTWQSALSLWLTTLLLE